LVVPKRQFQGLLEGDLGHERGQSYLYPEAEE
jgi:hypothetical protein